MIIIGIDTSTRCGSVGLVDGETVVCETLLNIPVTHSERLIPAIEYVLKQASLEIDSVDAWALSLGPGSFTGLRIGVSTVKGLAFAGGKALAGVPTLDGLAAQISPTPYLVCPILDARKGEVYTAFYRYDDASVLVRLSDYQAISPETLVREIRERTIFLGDGVKTYGERLQKDLPSYALFPPDPLHLLHGSTIARLGLDRLLKNDVLDPSSIAPIYVRASEAEIKWRERTGL